MANRVVTIFDGDPAPLFRITDQVESRLKNAFSNAFGKAQFSTTFAAPIQKATTEVETATKRMADNVERNTNRMNTAFKGIGGFLTGIVAGVGVAGIVRAIDGATEKYLEASRAQRLLASSATEAGLALEKATEKNKRFAELAGLSSTQAAGTTGAILRLAGRSGQPQTADKLLGGFADLGAAFGINGGDLQTLISTILSGQDEGLNRLGIADPSALYKKYAAEVGKTVEELTQMEKVQAAVNAVMEKSAMFAGAATDRQNSLEGQILRSKAGWDELSTAISTWTMTSEFSTSLIDEMSRAFGGLSLSISEVNRQLAEGKTPEEIAKQRGTTAFDVIRAALSAGPAAGLLINDLLSGESFETAFNRFGESIDPTKIAKRETSNLEDRIAGQDRLNKKQEAAAKLQREKLATSNQQLESAKKLSEMEKKLEEFERNQLSMLDDLGRRAYAENPFVALYSEADKALENVRKNTLLATDEIKAKFAELAVSANQFERFKLRLDSSLEANSLLDQASEFRNFVDPKETQRRQQKATRDFLAANPNYLFLKGEEYSRRQSDSRDPLSYNGQSFEEFIQDDLRKMNPRTFETPQQRFQERLDKQLEIINKAGASDERQKAEADRRILALAGSDPGSLRGDQREQVALAAEREAARKLRSEAEAAQIFRDQLEYQKQIAENTKLNKEQLKNGGLSAMKVIVEDKTGPETAVELQSPSMSDTQKQFQSYANALYAGGATTQR